MAATSTRHILVVEDDAGHRRMVTRMLERAGFRVTETEDFAGAIRVIEGDERVHLLLADIRLPAGTPNGITIGRMARLRHRRLAIVYMTGSYDPAALSDQAPDTPILTKPFTARELITTIEAALKAA